jgi:hypothetical protein
MGSCNFRKILTTDDPARPLAATKGEEPQKAQNTQDYGASRRISVPLAPFVVTPKFSQESKNWTDCSTDFTDVLSVFSV